MKKFYVLQLWRKVSRQKTKTALMMMIISVFLIAIMFMENAIINNQQEIEALYEKAEINAAVVRQDAKQLPSEENYISHRMIELLMEKELLEDVYLEATERTELAFNLFYTSDIGELEETSSLHTSVKMVYIEGWTSSSFKDNCNINDEVVPVVLHKNTAENMGIDLGDRFEIGERKFVVVGVHEGLVLANANETIIAPIGVWQDKNDINKVNTYYSKVKFKLASSWNSRYEEAYEKIVDIVEHETSGLIPLTVILQDAELKVAVEPLEKQIQFIRLLFPITQIVSVGTVAILELVFMLQNNKESAIMRALGVSQNKVAFDLFLEQVSIVIIGAIIGIILCWIISREWNFAVLKMAIGYIVITMLASYIGGLIILRKNPMEALQIKE